MATLDDLCAGFDEFGASGDTPMRFKLDGTFLELAAIHREPDGTITVELEQDPIIEEKPITRHASIHWGGDGI